MSDTPKEDFYDDKISPLMSEIIKLCQEAEIPMIADFALDYNDDEECHLKCTTHLLDPEWGTPPEMNHAKDVLRPNERSPMMVTTEKPDGSKTITAIL